MIATTTKTSVVALPQVAALPVMIGDDGIARVLLLTSCETGRWVIPKGWPMKGKKPLEAAAQEAWEEAGVGQRYDDEADWKLRILQTTRGVLRCLRGQCLPFASEKAPR